MKKKLICMCLLAAMCLGITACGDDSKPVPSAMKVSNGPVEGPEDFDTLGLVIDANSSLITSKSYTVVEDEIAVVAFLYDGMECEFRGSCIYSEFELAGLSHASSSNLSSTYVGGYPASYMKLDPGKVVFWSDGTVSYSLYTKVTVQDDVLFEILNCLSYENRYLHRPDVKADVEANSKVFAENVVKAINDRDKEALADMIKYPMMLKNGASASNKSEFLALSDAEIFTDKLVNAMNDDALKNLRTANDNEEEYVLGTNHSNVHFILDEDGKYIINKVNN